jgi:hypothetical protein
MESWTFGTEFKTYDKRIYSSQIPKEQYTALSEKPPPASLS